MIDELERKLSLNRTGRQFIKDNRKEVENLIENAKQLYKTRNDIINAFEKKEPVFEGEKKSQILIGCTGLRKN